MLHSEDYTFEFFDLESHAFSFEVISGNEFFGIQQFKNFKKLIRSCSAC